MPKSGQRNRSRSQERLCSSRSSIVRAHGCRAEPLRAFFRLTFSPPRPPPPGICFAGGGRGTPRRAPPRMKECELRPSPEYRDSARASRRRCRCSQPRPRSDRVRLPPKAPRSSSRPHLQRVPIQARQRAARRSARLDPERMSAATRPLFAGSRSLPTLADRASEAHHVMAERRAPSEGRRPLRGRATASARRWRIQGRERG
jgi:hypothetical protein